ncbi:hypothetical protein M422DRAFT_63229 [Sphaerobolus stellatus SS14]|nr:hypothetical protein M422DRAFT_63229 [Sphaerobolus stellatus SS14]
MSDPLPLAQLESLKYRVNQIVESIAALQFLIDANGVPAMPPWPDILARYNLLLSQMHSLSASLSFVATQQQQQQLEPGQKPPQNPLQKLSLHPGISLAEQQLDHGVAPLLRNQPTVQVLKEEDATVRRLSKVLKHSTPEGVPAMAGPEGCQRVVLECAEIKRQHDARVERAAKAVQLLRERYEWRARVEAPEPEPEDEQMEIVEASGGNEDDNAALIAPQPEGVEANDGRSSVASTPASARSDSANEAQVTEDVLGETGPPLG